MVCIYCGHKTKVINSRLQKKSNQTWRRRHCTSCGSTETTVERLSLDNVLLVTKKHENRSEAFYEDKLMISILKSIEHQKNPVIKARALTNTVISKLLITKPQNPNIKTEEIANITLSTLKNFDAAAALKYLSFQTDLKSSKDIKRSLL